MITQTNLVDSVFKSNTYYRCNYKDSYLNTAFDDLHAKFLRLKAEVLANKIKELGLPVNETVPSSYEMRTYPDKCEFWYTPDKILIVTFYTPILSTNEFDTINISLNYR